jgi:tetratricopeptide (TPR) repeat protein
MRCPHCQAPVLKIHTQCLKCGGELTKPSQKKRLKPLVIFLLSTPSILALIVYWVSSSDNSNSEIPVVAAPTNQPPVSQPQNQNIDQIPNSLLDAVERLMGEEKWQVAYNVLNSRLELGGRNNARFLSLLAQAAYKMEKPEEATQHLRRFIELQPDMQTNPDVADLMKKLNFKVEEQTSLQERFSLHFRLRYEGEVAYELSEKALSHLEQAYDDISVKLAYYPQEKISAILFQSAKFRGSDSLPDWAGAVYDGQLRVPVKAFDTWPASKAMLTHELAHAFIHDLGGSNVPVWLNEGLAQYFEGISFNDSIPLAMNAPPLNQLQSSFSDQRDRDHALILYIYAKAMADKLLQINKMAGMRDLLSGIKAGKDFNQMLLDQYSLTEENLYQSVLEQFKKDEQ